MDLFAYITLGVIALLAAIWIGGGIWQLIREPIGQAFLFGLAFVTLLLCGAVSAVWLIGTKLI